MGSPRSPLGRALAPLLVAGSLAVPAFAGDWPGYGGPLRNGHAVNEQLAAGWPADGPAELWRVSIGDDGYSAIAVASGRVFTMVGRDGEELAIALDAATGRELWSFSLGRNRGDGQGGGPRSTPTVDGDTVFVVGATGRLFALGAENGRVRWHVDLVDEVGARIPQWGLSSSPLVVDGLVVLDAGGSRDRSVVAFDAKTGELVWASQPGPPGYSSPIALEIAGRTQILVFTGEALVAVAPDSGEAYWRVPWSTSYDVNAALPVLVPPDGVFISSAYDTGAALFRVAATANGAFTTEAWRSKVMRNHFNSSLLVGEHLYGFDNGTLKCVEAATGTERWAHRGFGKGSLVAAGDLLVVFGERGELALVRAVPDRYDQLSETTVFSSRTWSQPALAGGTLYVRSQKEMVALDVGHR